MREELGIVIIGAGLRIVCQNLPALFSGATFSKPYVRSRSFPLQALVLAVPVVLLSVVLLVRVVTSATLAAVTACSLSSNALCVRD